MDKIFRSISKLSEATNFRHSTRNSKSKSSNSICQCGHDLTSARPPKLAVGWLHLFQKKFRPPPAVFDFLLPSTAKADSEARLCVTKDKG